MRERESRELTLESPLRLAWRCSETDGQPMVCPNNPRKGDAGTFLTCRKSSSRSDHAMAVASHPKDNGQRLRLTGIDLRVDHVVRALARQHGDNLLHRLCPHLPHRLVGDKGRVRRHDHSLISEERL